MGRIALLSNHLDVAKNWLEKAIALRPGDSDPKVMLAEAYYRRDDFEKAAASLTGVDVSANRLIVSQYPTLNVAKLRSFQGQTPYEVHGDGQSTRLKLLKTDPLPLVSVRVNGSEEVTFFIDTGASEVTLDTEFARELGVPQFGSVQGTFSGGQNAEVQQGRIEALKVGDWTVRNLPVAMLPLRQLSQHAQTVYATASFFSREAYKALYCKALFRFRPSLRYPLNTLRFSLSCFPPASPTSANKPGKQFESCGL